jgi:predicted nucleic acid-binding protein
MIVVADTTPINYLVLIGKIELLPSLYRVVLIPQAVHRELQSTKAPGVVREWASALPFWCEVHTLRGDRDGSMKELDDGERDAIQLALENGIDTVLIDESEGRRAAVQRHLKVTGTVALLEKAGQRGLLDFRSALTELERTNFRISASIREEFLRRNP